MTNESDHFVLPSPKFRDEVTKSLDNYNRHLNPHFSSPSGMLLPRDKQPPPMYGPRGSTVPPQYLGNSRKRPFPSGGENFRPFHQSGQNSSKESFKNGRGCQNFQGTRSHGSHKDNRLDKEVNPNLLRLDWKLWCDGCDVNCRSEEEYQSHLANHVPCSVEGCMFVGHPIIMKKHMKQTHITDVSCKQLGPVPSREEIEMWKEERRKRYPTKTNVILRQQVQEERFKRGERILENKDRFPNRATANCPLRNNGAKNVPSQIKHPRRQKRKQRIKRLTEVASIEPYGGRIPFKGTSLLWPNKNSTKNALEMLGKYGTDSDSSSEDELKKTIKLHSVENPGKSTKEEITLEEKNAEERLSCIPSESLNVPVTNSDAEVTCVDIEVAENNRMMEKDSKEDNPPPPNEISNTVETHVKVENEIKSEKCRSSKTTKKPCILIARKERKEKKWLLDYSKLRRSNQNTMLEKLLDGDIRHERNVLLQCVRHVVVHHFFAVDSPCSSKTI